MIYLKRGLLRGTSIVAIVAILGGCQTTNIGSNLPGGYLSDRGDACYDQRVALDSTGNTFETELVRNVLIGGAAGTVAALAAGENPFAGAAIGAVAAAAGTFLYNLQQNYGDPVEQTDAAIASVREENERIDTLLQRFEALKGCRKREADQIRVQLADGEIPRATAQDRMAGVRERYREDVEQLERIARNIADRTESYAAVYNQIAADNDGGQLVVEDPKPTVAPAATAADTSDTQSVRTRQMYVQQGSNVRAGPSVNESVVDVLVAGTEVTVLGETGDWYRIRTPQDEEAYIARFLLGPGADVSPPKTESARIEQRPAKKPVQDDKLEPVVLPADQREEKVGELQDVSLANVEKRDRVFDEVATAQAEEDSDFALS